MLGPLSRAIARGSFATLPIGSRNDHDDDKM